MYLIYLYNIIILLRTDGFAVRGPRRHPVRARIVYLHCCVRPTRRIVYIFESLQLETQENSTGNKWVSFL